MPRVYEEFLNPQNPNQLISTLSNAEPWLLKNPVGLAHGYMHQAQLRGQVQRGVTVVGKVGVLEALRVVLDDAFEEGEVFEVDGSADTDGDVNPPIFLRIELENMLEVADSHGCYGKWISRKRVSLQMSMADVKPSDARAKVLFR